MPSAVVPTPTPVLHVDIDAFFASVEQLRNPRLRGQPVAVGAGVIASCSYEARKFGLRAGLPLSKARKLCPKLRIIDGHAAIYRSFSERLFDICHTYSPSVETFLDEAFCDLSGTERLFGGDLARQSVELKERILRETGLRVTVGLAPNRMLAKMAASSVKPDGLRQLLPSEQEAFLLDQPVGRLLGVGPKAAKTFAKLNVRTIGELRSLSRSSLVGIFGKIGECYYERCRGRDTRPVSPREVPRSISRETSFHEHTADPQVIEGTLYYLAERAANTLRQLGLKTRCIEVKIRYGSISSLEPLASSAGGDAASEGGTNKSMVSQASRQTLETPTQLDSEIFRCAVRLYHRLHTRRISLRLVGIALSQLVFDTGYRQLDLLDCLSNAPRKNDGENDHPAKTPPEQELSLLHSLDHIRKRYGHSSVICGRSLDLLGKLEQDDHGFVLRTSSLTL